MPLRTTLDTFNDELNAAFDALDARVDALEAQVSVLMAPTAPPPVPLPTLTISDATVNEGAAAAVVVVSLTHAYTADVSFLAETMSGSAVGGEDFTPLVASFTIPAGQTQISLSVPILNDALVEPDEQFTVTLRNVVNATVVGGTAVVTVQSDDVAPPPPPPTNDAFAFLRPHATLAAGQSVAVPNTRMRPAFINDTSQLTRYSDGAEGIFTDWASTALIRSTGRLVWWGGGHASTNDSSVYEINLATGQRRRAWKTYEMQGSSAQYPKGAMLERDNVTVQNPERAPRSAHAYGGLLPIPGRDAFLVAHTDSLHPVDLNVVGWTGPWADWEFDFGRLAAGQEPWLPYPGPPKLNPPAGAVLRPDGKLVIHANYDFTKTLADGTIRTFWDRTTGSLNEGCAYYDAGRDATILVAWRQGVYQIPHVNGTVANAIRIMDSASLGTAFDRGAPAIVQHPGRDLVVLWNGRNEFAWFTPGGTLTKWTVPGVYPAGGPWSVNHKLHYMPELGADIFLMVGGPDDDLALIRLPFDDPGSAQAPTQAVGVTAVTPSTNLQVAFNASAAGPVSADGKRIVRIEAGLYEQAAVITGPDTRVECAAGVVFRNVAVEGKAAIIIRADRVEWIGGRFEHPSTNFETVPNLAAFRLEAKDITFRNVYIRDYQMGVLGGTIYGWATKRLQTDRGYVRFYDCTIEDIGKVSYDNGLWQNLSHNIYIAAYDELTVERCAFRRSWAGGHLIKSRCRNTTILDSTLDQGAAPGSLAVDIPNGGNALIAGTAIVHGSRADNADVIGFAKEYWGDLPPPTVTDHEYSGLASNVEKLWPGVSSLLVDTVSLHTEVAEVPHWEPAVYAVRGPNIPEVTISLANLVMTRAVVTVLLQFSTRPYTDLGGNVK